ncbi:hypothetical protein Tco_1273627 [Tanacetum coccineum]
MRVEFEEDRDGVVVSAMRESEEVRGVESRGERMRKRVVDPRLILRGVRVVERRGEIESRSGSKSGRARVVIGRERRGDESSRGVTRKERVEEEREKYGVEESREKRELRSGECDGILD